jgi:hypothetical protein
VPVKPQERQITRVAGNGLDKTRENGKEGHL